jgi:ribonuclease VapC
MRPGPRQVEASSSSRLPVSKPRFARAAYRDFGKGGGRPAGLNFGDCFAYALARARREPLLCKGDDFSQTDVPVA